ncbi:hypothetical protein MKX01_021795 [Papaver californicum]|nr:hypothetical protein MKX01_021795 [Papaver californicum]
MPVNSFHFLVPFLIASVSLFTRVFSVNDQGEALLSWKMSLNGTVHVFKDWNQNDATPCSWFGVTCNINHQVSEFNISHVDLYGHVPSNLTSLSISLYKLVLTGTNLTGSIPKEIGLLSELNLLDLSDNALTNEIPNELCNLFKLEKLFLNSNRLKGSIPNCIGKLSSLKWLVFYDNQLSGGIPTAIGDMKKLEILRGGGNKNLEGPLPKEIGNCSELVMLGLAETSISGFLPYLYSLLSGQIPSEIGDCTELVSIYLYENSLTGSIPSRLGNLQNLQNLLLCELMVIDASMNSLTGSIPPSFVNLSNLLELQLRVNQVSGRLPSQLSNCQSLTHIELDNNQLTGNIPTDIGLLQNLTILFLWQNKLEGSIPASLGLCKNLEAIDFSQNSLIGSIPKGIFELKYLNKLLLLSNNLSGEIPAEIGECTSLIRFRANDNKITGPIPSGIGNLTNLSFLDLGSNRLVGKIPEEISGCQNLTFLDLHSNSLTGILPEKLHQLESLQLVDFSGPIPSEVGSCSKLQLLDLSGNELSGEIPATVGKIASLEIALNLSSNRLSGKIPQEFSSLEKLGILDISYNQLTGDLQFLSSLQNLVVLNISFNDFSGRVPYTPFFTKLPLSDLAGNPSLCFSGNHCSSNTGRASSKHRAAAKIARIVLLCAAAGILLAALYIIVREKRLRNHDDDIDGSHYDADGDGDDDVTMGPPWEVTLYQKLDLSIYDVERSLTAVNVIGKGRSGIVYKAHIPSGLTIAVKKYRNSDKVSTSAFSSEIATLARIRHRNIVRLLGWGANRKSKLLFYDYLPNGTLGQLLHDHEPTTNIVEWETRFKIALAVAEGLSYMHHDCVPPILHRDVKAHNILLGDRYEAVLADFGLARLVEDDNGSFSANPQFAGSYGYFDPEYGNMLKITEKSDVYSYGVVLLEIITGNKPVDPAFPEEQHIVQWVREHLKNKKDPAKILDPKLQGRPDPQIQEMLQALGISLLCASNRAEDRPTMTDVAALLREIRQEQPAGTEHSKPGSCWKKPSTSSKKRKVVILQHR